MRNVIFLIAVLFLFGSPFTIAQAQTIENVGFVPNNIWFSKDPFFAGNKIEIFTFLFNCRDEKLTGVLAFYDKDILLGKTDFSISGGCATKAVSISWTATVGSHTISAKILEAKLHGANSVQDVVLKTYATGEHTKIVEGDNDGDNISDTTDPDDDNDGVSDAQEQKQGTDSLNNDTDSDGLKDGEDPDPLTANVVEKTGIIERGKEVAEKALETIPEGAVSTAKDTAVETAGVLEEFRKDKKEKISEISLGLKKKLDASKEVSDTDPNEEEGDSLLNQPGASSPFTYALFVASKILYYILAYKIIFYGIMLGVFYLLVRFLIGIFRRRID